MEVPQILELMKGMSAEGVFILKVGDLHIEMSQYKFAPKMPALPVNPPIPEQDDISDYPPEQRAPFQALSPMQSIAAAMGAMAPKPKDEKPLDPTDPNGPINDEELFGSNLPQPN